MNIQILNLSLNTENRDLRRLFTTFGHVTSAEVSRDKWTGRSKCHAIVEMDSEKDGRMAIESLHQTELDGKKISVSEYHTDAQW